MRLALLLAIPLGVLQIVSPPGLDFVHRNSPTEQKYIIETMGGGVALLDYNNDGLLDIFLVNSGKLDNEKPTGSSGQRDFGRRNPVYWNRLYRQNRDGSFQDVTREAGLSNAGNSYGMGVATGDYNNDGFPDIYVTNFGQNILYRNNGDGTFRDVTDSAGTGAGGWSVSAGFFDYDNDGKLDLFVTRYLNYSLDRNVLCGTPFHSYCRPDKYPGTTNILYHNEGNGHFRDVSEESGIGATTGKGMGVAFNDFDGDGFSDIFVANDLMEQFMFHNRGNGKFEECALRSGVALSDDGKPFSGMGAVFADYDNDGWPDILVTNLALEKWALYRNEGGKYFSYASQSTGLAGLTAQSSGWGAGMQDFDNDGWKDIFAAQGHVLDNVGRIHSALRYLEPPGLYRNVAGKFESAALGDLPAVAGRGAAFGDLNNDGAMDAVISTLGGRPLVFHGASRKNHWLTLSLTGTRSNRQGLGAKVRIGKQWVYASTSGSYLSGNDSRVHFGLGGQTRVAVEVVWPSGKRQSMEDVAVDRVMTVQEPE